MSSTVTKVGNSSPSPVFIAPFFPTHKKLGSLGLFKQAKSAVKYLYGGGSMQKQRQLDPFILQKYEVVIVLLAF